MSSESALAGLRVLDLSRFIAGPYCAQLLGDQGADVVKVERPNGGDDTRGVHPQVEGESLYFMAFNRNKRGVTLDFRDPADQERLRALIRKADIVIENFRPGTMEKMGCGYETLRELNPRLIMVRISGFGSEGPLADQPCFDIIAQAMSGIMSITGEPDRMPMKAGTYLVDYATALYATIGVLSAVEARHRTGKGQLVEVNLLDSAMSMLMTGIPEALMLDRNSQPPWQSRPLHRAGQFLPGRRWHLGADQRRQSGSLRAPGSGHGKADSGFRSALCHRRLADGKYRRHRRHRGRMGRRAQRRRNPGQAQCGRSAIRTHRHSRRGGSQSAYRRPQDHCRGQPSPCGRGAAARPDHFPLRDSTCHSPPCPDAG